MTLSSMQDNEFADLPVLTEAVGTDIEIPTLTEIVAEEVTAFVAQTAALANSPDTDCKSLAAQIAPQLETLLRNKLAARFDALWQETWHEVQASLPELIQTRLAAQHPVIEAMQNSSDSVRAELAEACAEHVEVAHSPFDKLRANGLQTSSDRINSNTAGIIAPPFDKLRACFPAAPINTTKMELAKSFEPQAIEARWYPYWEQADYFKAGLDQNKKGNFCILLPPPNVTGTLHMGHGFNQTLMDALTRYHRMRGGNTLWQPGTDHAGIATQIVVERQLEAQKISRHDLGREKFIERVWQWKEESGSTITRQMRRLGTSPDWSRERFTMDEGLSRAVTETFVRLYKEGLIYRGKRLVNWDPKLHTAVSDLEVVQEEEDGFMWYIRYPLAEPDSARGLKHLTVATTRPETMLGDVAVMVHPEDERYKHLIGKQVTLPFPTWKLCRKKKTVSCGTSAIRWPSRTACAA